MAKFGIKKKPEKNLKYYSKYINIVFTTLIVICFAIFAFYSNVTNIIFGKDKVDIFKKDLQQVAFYFWNIDENVSKMLLNIDEISKSYMSGDNVLIQKEDTILKTLDYIQKNQDYLKNLGFEKYGKLIDLLEGIKNNRDEVSNLLGKEQEYNYLVILQNTNEKRPNGGFFGSFAFITVKDGRLENLEIVDAYYPDYIAHYTRLQAPSRTTSFLPDRKIGFIAGNKFGFSDIDGSNLKWLYEKMFNEDYVMRKVEQTMAPGLYEKLLHKHIKGIIFIRSDLIEYLLPSFTEIARERQFQNANVDIIRGEYRGNKKEEYTKEVTEYFQKNQLNIFKKIVNNFDEIIDKNFINIYLSNVSDDMQNLLLKHGLKTVYNTGNIYARDTNTSYNKVDGFVEKNIQIIDTSGKIIIDTDNDIVDIQKLSSGEYTMKIYYTLNVPNYYKDFIRDLQEEYDIEMTNRELGILAMKPAKYEDNVYEKWMETKATVYFPPNFDITKINGQQQEHKEFTTPFANGLYYKMLINENNTTKNIEIKFIIE
ncbi:MAG TPA: DUF4012 domain-containing protein [Candidatus Absconditabacterales bacterium]|nr:DUF4012 domain-containing protein [Candidatus Absconditabacterales bacterium]